MASKAGSLASWAVIHLSIKIILGYFRMVSIYKVSWVCRKLLFMYWLGIPWCVFLDEDTSFPVINFDSARCKLIRKCDRIENLKKCEYYQKICVFSTFGWFSVWVFRLTDFFFPLNAPHPAINLYNKHRMYFLILWRSLLLLLSRFSRVRLCATPSLGFSRQEHWSGLPFPSPVHESEKWKWSHSVVPDC